MSKILNTLESKVVKTPVKFPIPDGTLPQDNYKNISRKNIVTLLNNIDKIRNLLYIRNKSIADILDTPCEKTLFLHGDFVVDGKVVGLRNYNTKEIMPVCEERKNKVKNKRAILEKCESLIKTLDAMLRSITIGPRCLSNVNNFDMSTCTNVQKDVTMPPETLGYNAAWYSDLDKLLVEFNKIVEYIRKLSLEEINIKNASDNLSYDADLDKIMSDIYSIFNILNTITPITIDENNYWNNMNKIEQQKTNAMRAALRSAKGLPPIDPRD